MTYIGLSPPNTFTKSTSQTFTGNGSTTAFTLQTRVSSPEDLEVFVSNVQQQPTESYTIGSDGVTMTFSEAPPSGTFYVIYRTVAQQAGTDTGASRLGENNTFTGTQTFNADVSLLDNVKVNIGSDSDGYIRHTGSAYQLINSTGSIVIKNLANNQDVVLQTDDGSGATSDYIRCDGSEGEVSLYHYGSEKFATTSTGVAVTGNVDINGGELILDADADTSITADTDDQIDLKVGGTDTIVVKPDVVEIKGSHPDLKLMDTDDNNYGGLFYNNGSITLATDHDATGATGIIKFAIDGNEDVRIDSGGDLKINDGNLVIGTSGHGIDFSATTDGYDANGSELLADYERGAYNLTFNGFSQQTVSQGSYVRVGHLCFVTMMLHALGSQNSNQFTCTLPFTSQGFSASNNTGYYSSTTSQIMHHNVDTGTVGLASFVVQGTNTFKIYKINEDGAWSAINNNAFSSEDQAFVSITYIVA